MSSETIFIEESIASLLKSVKLKRELKKEFAAELEKYAREWMKSPGARTTDQFNKKIREISNRYKADIPTAAAKSILTKMQAKRDEKKKVVGYGMSQRTVYEENVDEEVSTAGALGSHSASDGRNRAVSPPMPKVQNIPSPDGSCAGKPYFNCDADTFNKARMGRAKGQRWSTFLGSKNDWADGVRRWSRKNGNPDFMLRHGNMYIYAQRGIK
jgi:hypothetical protein